MRLDFDTILSLLFLIFFIVVPLVTRAQRRGRGGSAADHSGSAPDAAPREPRTAGAPTAEEEALPGWLREAQRRVREAQEQQEDARGTRPAAAPQPPSGGGLTRDTGGLFEAPRHAPASGGAPVLGREGPQGPASRGLGRMPTGPSVPGALGREGPGAGGLGRMPTTAAAGSLGREARPVPGSGPAGREPLPGSSVLGPEGRPVPRSPAAGRPAPGGLGREARPAVGPARAPGALGREGVGRGDEVEATRVLRSPSRRPSGQRPAGLEPSVVGKRPPVGPAGATLGAAGLLSMDRRSIVRALIWHEILDQPAWKRHGRTLSRHRSR